MPNLFTGGVCCVGYGQAWEMREDGLWHHFPENSMQFQPEWKARTAIHCRALYLLMKVSLYARIDSKFHAVGGANQETRGSQRLPNPHSSRGGICDN